MLPHRTAARKEKHANASICSTKHARSTPKKTTRSAQVSDHMQVEAAPQMGLDSGKHRRGRGTSAASLEATCVALISSHHPCCAACLLYGLKGAGGARGALVLRELVGYAHARTQSTRTIDTHMRTTRMRFHQGRRGREMCRFLWPRPPPSHALAARG